MNILFGMGLREIVVIVILEVLLCLNCVALGFSSKGKTSRYVNFAFAVLWAVCAVLNLIAA